MLTLMSATGASKIARSSMGFVVETAAKWAIDELSPKAHHLSFQDVQTLHNIFQPLFKVDQEAIQCFAHLVSNKQTDPQQDIRYPAATKGTLKLTQIDPLAVSKINSELGTVQEYLEKGLTLSHGKINRSNNYHYAVAAGILNWFHHRLPVWLSECIANPAKIDVVFNALLQSLDKLKAQDNAKEKHEIIDGLTRVIKNELVPELKRIVANKSAANHFADMQKAAAQVAIDGQKMVAALSHRAHTEKQPNLVFYTVQGAKDGYFCEQAGNNALKIGKPLIPKVPLQGPLANGLRESARIAMEGNIAVIAPSALALDDKEKQEGIKTLHPACSTKPVVESGNKNVKLVEMDDAQQIKNIEHLQQLLFRFSELQALSRLFGRLERFAAFVGGKAMFNPTFLQKTLFVLKNKLHTVNQQILTNPLFQQVDTLMDCGKFTKTHKDCLNYGEGNATPNLKQLVQDIKSNLNAMDKAMQALDFKRANFDQVVQDAMDDQKAIIAGIQTIVGDQVLVDDISKELQQASGLPVNAMDENEYDETIRPALQGTPTTKQYLAIRDQLTKQLDFLCDLHNKSDEIATIDFSHFLRKVFEGTCVRWDFVRDKSDKRSRLVLHVTAWDYQSMAKLHVAVKTAINQVIIEKLNQQNQIQMEAIKRHQSQALWPKNSEACYRHLKLIDAYLQENKPLNEPEFLALMQPLLALEPAADKKFLGWLNGLLPKNYFTVEPVNESLMLRLIDDFKKYDPAKPKPDRYSSRCQILNKANEGEKTSPDRRPLFEEETYLGGNPCMYAINQLIKLSNYGVNVGGWWISTAYLPFEVLDQVLNPILQKGGKFVRIKSSCNHRLNHRGLSEVRFVVTDQEALNKLLADKKTYEAIGKGLANLAQPHSKNREANVPMPLQLSTPPKSTYNYTHEEKGYQQFKVGVGEMLTAMEKPLAVISDSAMINQKWINTLEAILNVPTDGVQDDDKSGQQRVAEQLIPQLIQIQQLKNMSGVSFNQKNYEHQLQNLFAGTGIKFRKTMSGQIEINAQQSQAISLDCVKTIQENIQNAYGDLNKLPATITQNGKADEAVISTLKGIETVSQQMARQHSPEYENQTKQINELKATLIVEQKYGKKWEELCKQKNEEMRKQTELFQLEMEKSINQLDKIKDDNIEASKKVENYETELNQINSQLAILKQSFDEQSKQVNELKISQHSLQSKNKQLNTLLEEAIKETLEGIDAIINNNSELLYIVFGVKHNININSNELNKSKKAILENDKDIFSDIEIDDEQREIVEMASKIGAREKHKEFLNRFIKEVEQSVLKNQAIAKKIKNNLVKSLNKGQLIKDDISKLDELAFKQLLTIESTIDTQKGIVKILSQIIDQLENEIKELKKELSIKNKNIIKLKKEKQELTLQFNEQLKVRDEKLNQLQTEKDEEIKRIKIEAEKQQNTISLQLKEVQQTLLTLQRQSVQTDNAPTINEKVEAEPTTAKETCNDAQLGAYADKSGWAYFWYIVGDWTIAAIPNFFIGLGSGFGLWGNFQSLFSQRAWKQHEETEQCKEREEKIPPKINHGVVTLEPEDSQTKITKKLPKSSNKSASLLNESDEHQTEQGNKQSVVSVMKNSGSPVITNVQPESEAPDLALSPKPTHGAALNYV